MKQTLPRRGPARSSTTSTETFPPPLGPRKWSWHKRASEFFEQRAWAYILIIPSLLVVGAVVIYPVFSGILLSLQDYRLTRPGLDRPFIGLDHFIRLLGDPIMRTAASNTAVYVVVGTLSQFLLGLGAALLLNRRFRGVSIARMLVMVPWFMPPVVTAHMWSLMLSSRLGVVNDVLVRVGILDSYRAWFADPSSALYVVLSVELWRSFPFFALFLLAGLQAVPHELNEAATVDGAGVWSRFRYITLPLLTPVIVVATVLQVIRLTNIPDMLIVLTGGGPGNATQVMSLYAFQTAYSAFDFGYAAAISVMLMVSLMGFTMVYMRITGAMERGDVAA